MSKITWALSSWVCKYPDDLTRVAKDADFKAIEWDLNYIPIPLSIQRIHQLKKEFNNYGLLLRYHLPYSTCDIGSSRSRIRETSEKYVQLNLEMIGKLEADYAILHFGSYKSNIIPPLDSLINTVELAKELGITIALENLTIGPTSNPDILKKIILKSGAKAALDVGHAISINNLQNYLYLLGPMVSHVHFYGYEDEKRNHLPFELPSEAINTAKNIQNMCSAKWWTCEMDSLNSCIQTKKLLQEHKSP